MGSISRALRRKPFPKPNFYIGGAGNYYTTEAQYAAQFDGPLDAIVATMIKRLKIDPTTQEASFYIRRNINAFYVHSFQNHPLLTHFFDLDGKIGRLGQGAFGTCPLKAVYWPRINTFEGPSGYDTLSGAQMVQRHVYQPGYRGDYGNQNYAFNTSNYVKWLWMRDAWNISTQIAARATHQGYTNLYRLNIASISQLNSQSVSQIFTNLPPGCIVYINLDIYTVDKGNRENTIAWWEDSRGVVFRFVTNFVNPDPVTNLAVTNIGADRVDLTFTPPAVTANPLDFYEVWIDNDAWVGQDRWKKLGMWQEIVNSGDTLIELEANTTYRVKLKTADYFWNISEFSEEVEFTTDSGNTVDMRNILFPPTCIGHSWANAGTKLYVSTGNYTIREYTLSTAYDLSTASFVQETANLGSSGGFYITEDGAYLLYSLQTSVELYELQTLYDISTLNSLGTNTVTGAERGCFLRADGLKLYVQGIGSLHEYNIDVAFDISNITFVQTVNAMPNSEDFSFSPDGLKIYSFNVNKDLYFADLGTAWDISTIPQPITNNIDLSGVVPYNGTDNFRSCEIGHDGTRISVGAFSSPDYVQVFLLEDPYHIGRLATGLIPASSPGIASGLATVKGTLTNANF